MIGRIASAFGLLIAAGGLHLVASIPEQIALSYGKEPSAMVVTWASSVGDLSGECHYGTDKNNLDSISLAIGSTYKIEDYESPILFSATLTGLVAGNQIYYYTVGSDSEGYSEVFSFKSHPGVGVAGVTIHVVGDLGQTSNTRDTLEEVQHAEQALSSLSGGILNMGDLSYANGDQPLWDEFANFKQFVATEIPMLTTLGNHEFIDDRAHTFQAYTSRFINPSLASGKRELYYSYDIGLAHVVMVAGYCTEMHTEYARHNPCLANGSAQMDWLVQDLANVDKELTPWTFVVFHEPYVNSNKKHNIKIEGAPMQEAIEDTLYAAGVDLVMTGHVHAYERSCRVYKYVCQDNAPYYITIGDGGNKEGLADEWVEPQPDWSLFRQASYGYGELNVLNSTHTLWQWHQNQDLAPTVADEFWVIKESKTRSGNGVTRYPKFADNSRGRLSFTLNAKRREQWKMEQAELEHQSSRA